MLWIEYHTDRFLALHVKLIGVPSVWFPVLDKISYWLNLAPHVMHIGVLSVWFLFLIEYHTDGTKGNRWSNTTKTHSKVKSKVTCWAAPFAAKKGLPSSSVVSCPWSLHLSRQEWPGDSLGQTLSIPQLRDNKYSSNSRSCRRRERWELGGRQ